jgi:methylsterol monooxygenase
MTHAAAARWMTWTIRAVHLFLALVVVLDPSWANDALARAWARLHGHALVHHRMFEALVATGSFGVSIGMFKLADALPCLAAYRFVKQPLPPWRLAAAVERWLTGAFYLGAIYVFHCFKTKAPLHPTPPTARILGIDVLLGVLAYDCVEFAIHLSLHRVERLKPLHRRHHAQARLTAPETLNHGLRDATQQVAVNILVQRLSLSGGPKHALARLLHNVLVTYMLAEIHSGYDAPWSMHNVWPWVCGGAKRHEVHHRDGTVYYAEFFSVLDDVLGTTPAPREWTRAAAASGAPGARVLKTGRGAERSEVDRAAARRRPSARRSLSVPAVAA